MRVPTSLLSWLLICHMAWPASVSAEDSVQSQRQERGKHESSGDARSAKEVPRRDRNGMPPAERERLRKDVEEIGREVYRDRDKDRNKR